MDVVSSVMESGTTSGILLFQDATLCYLDMTDKKYLKVLWK